MAIRIYNSLTKQKEDFVPINGKTVNMYSCGVTVYDKCHIGHARSLYIFDVIKRYLEYRGFQVNFVRNITDVDDKIIAKANQLKKTFEDVVAENIAFYEQDLKTLGIARANKAEPRATENIDGMISHIQQLIAKGAAYEKNGDVYFSVRSFKDYGKLSGQSVDKMLEAVRIDVDDKKNDPLDFALWKKSKPGEPFWTSPWGDGRPGWHIECSVMSLRHLNCTTLDIHAGGRDLIFPHHENEIAQAEALTGKPFAKYWIHHGLLTINGEKMAKSLGNFITVEDAVKKFAVDDLKWFFLASHYASAIDFRDEKITEAHKALERIKIFLSEAKNFSQAGIKPCVVCPEHIEKQKIALIAAMDDDFNTAHAIGILFELLTEVYKQNGKEIYSSLVVCIGQFVKDFVQNVLGLALVESSGKMAEEEIARCLAERQQARLDKNFKKSDEIRDLLKNKGVIVEDGKDGQRWRWS
ncbi:MAG: cysteine--tRNA ligase [Candidatus Omnitrophica bacterium]|nr:cysteine--tRNA ligase [Candidatus Omnitrophota bacterium]